MFYYTTSRKDAVTITPYNLILLSGPFHYSIFRTDTTTNKARLVAISVGLSAILRVEATVGSSFDLLCKLFLAV